MAAESREQGSKDICEEKLDNTEFPLRVTNILSRSLAVVRGQPSLYPTLYPKPLNRHFVDC